MSGIRVTYSGLISLVLGIGAIFLSLMFTLIVTRTLEPIEFGTWGLITGLIIYATFIEPIVNYWATREIARGTESGRTIVASGSLLSIAGIAIYFLAAIIIGQQSDADNEALLFGMILIPVLFINRMLSGINTGWKPHAPLVASFIFAIIEIILALFFVYYLEMGVEGVVLTVTLAYIGSIFVLFYYAKEKLKTKINFEYLKKWIRLSWLPLYPAIGTTILVTDITVFSIITGSVIGLAFWVAAAVIAGTIENSGLISRAVYAKLLQGREPKYLENNITQLFYFAIFISAITITFARPGLFILNPEYEVAFPIVIILSFQMFFHTIRSQFLTFVTGVEKVDAKKNSTFKDYIKSKLFFVPTLILVQSIIYISTLTIGLLILKTITDSTMDLLTYWASVSLITQIPFFIYSFILLRRDITVSINFKSVGKYFIVSVIIFGTIYFVIEEFLTYNESVYVFIPNVLIYLAIGVLSYIIITYFIDSNTKALINSIIKEIKNIT